jgi:4-hydroxy-tetrahydrodipicolinate reductase
MSISVAVVGATGRMGKLAIELIEAAQDLELFAALDSKSDIAQTIGADVVIDLTRFDVSQAVVEHAVVNNQKLVVGTSGWSATHLQQLEKKLQSSEAAVVVVPNFSVGSMLANTNNRRIGSNFSGVAVFSDARHDDTRIFNQVLTLADIEYLYAGGFGRGRTRRGIIPILRQHYAAQGVR